MRVLKHHILGRVTVSYGRGCSLGEAVRSGRGVAAYRPAKTGLIRRTQKLGEANNSTAVLARAGESALIERWFPYRELSLVAQADRRVKDPKFAAHTWWARRPPSVFRGILLAAALRSKTSVQEFWDAFEAPAPWLQGLRVADDFAGGGTTAVEAARLGAHSFASDIDPLAVEIARHQLADVSEIELRQASEQLLKHLRQRVAHLFDSRRRGWTVVHHFYLRAVTCPSCDQTAPLYRDLLLARNPDRVGSVKRDFGAIAFCPDCLSIHELDSPDRKQLKCCGKTHRLSHATYHAQSFVCPSCEATSSHRELRTGKAPRILVAIEETRTVRNGDRRFRMPSRPDQERERASELYLARQAHRFDIPRTRIPASRGDDRPRSYGIKAYRDLFSARQLALFAHGFAWIRAQTGISVDTRRALTLATSSALATNNLLCGYARDYGRLSALFSVRGYSLPALSVELNPLQEFAGRGTLPRTLDRVCRSTSNRATRHVWSVTKNRPEKRTVLFEGANPKHRVELRSAVDFVVPTASERVDMSVFDPPYFDYIAYDELSEFFRVWHQTKQLAGEPLLPSSDEPGESFAGHLAECLSSMWKRVHVGRPMVFSFHSSSADAWKAIGSAVDRSESLVTAIWPVKTDTHMGHHSHDGNCEWDLVVVLRRRQECRRAMLPMDAGDWFRSLRGIKIRERDKQNIRLAVDMARTRFGRVVQTKTRRGPK